jgi:hypothetical protein
MILSMTNRANQDPSASTRVSPQTLANLFNSAAENLLYTGAAQRLGSYVVAYKNQASIKQHPVRNRVTHAYLVKTSSKTGPIVTHEVHLPSRDKEDGDFEAAKAIFEAHEYDEAGSRVGTERTVLDQIDLAGGEIKPFVEQVHGLAS